MKHLIFPVLASIIACSSTKEDNAPENILSPYSVSLEYEVLNDHLNYNTYFVEGGYMEVFDSIQIYFERHENPKDTFKFSMLLADSLELLYKKTCLNYFDRVWDSTFFRLDSIKFDSLITRKLDLRKIKPRNNFKLITNQVNNYKEIDSLYKFPHFKGYQIYSRMIFNNQHNKVVFFKHFFGKIESGTYLVKLKKLNGTWVKEYEEIIVIS